MVLGAHCTHLFIGKKAFIHAQLKLPKVKYIFYMLNVHLIRSQSLDLIILSSAFRAQSAPSLSQRSLSK